MKYVTIIFLVGLLLGVMLGRSHAWCCAQPTASEPAKTSMCLAFKLMDKTCVSARMYVKMYGRAEAERRARLCGATDADIAQAATCLHGDFQ
jgi:hypothetical protein